MDVQSKLMQKLGIAITSLAVEFLPLNKGDRIKTVAELADSYQTARGTIQSAIKFLKQEEAVTLESRGHLGTFIKEIDYIKLLELTGIKSLVGVMPLPYSKRYEGLATGIYKCLNDNGVNTNLAFMRGSNHRLKALEDGRYDFAVTSRLTADYYLENNKNIQIVKTFGDFSYVNEHIIVVAKDFNGKFTKGTRVGIDTSSIDQFMLTKTYFKDLEVQYVTLNYSQFINAIKENEIDVAIWNLDDIQDRKDDIKFLPLDREKNNIKDTEAVIIANKENSIVPVLFSRVLDTEEVKEYQELVMEKKIMPQY
ncbi:GntR family transcriptional regulator YhfZ [Clostridium sp. AL.422]|uniref:GntR family transcriptional regulator YhfZ n=1 Tax=Clostridium TaxID=1485 RepID=UPI00293DDCCB|nr:MULTISPECIES: GntR family transcriptional regulator YhfZ [unclassified Clostridium]MDV4150413.1 GntR family transcriptional regulator YhfZ [Clostridium sp. AL.422]